MVCTLLPPAVHSVSVAWTHAEGREKQQLASQRRENQLTAAGITAERKPVNSSWHHSRKKTSGCSQHQWLSHNSQCSAAQWCSLHLHSCELCLGHDDAFARLVDVVLHAVECGHPVADHSVVGTHFCQLVVLVPVQTKKNTTKVHHWTCYSMLIKHISASW